MNYGTNSPGSATAATSTMPTAAVALTAGGLVKVITVPGEILDALAREYDVAAKVGLTTKAKTQKSIAIVDCMEGIF